MDRFGVYRLRILPVAPNRDGSRRNLIARCPVCGKEGERRKPFMAHCFSCGVSTRSLNRLLSLINREDLRPAPVVNPEAQLNVKLLFPLETDMEIDDSLSVVLEIFSGGLINIIT